MVIKGKDIVGLRIVAIQEGQQSYYIEDILYDPITQKVRAFIVRNGGLFSDTQLLLLENIIHIGEDAVMIQSVKNIQKASQVDESILSIVKSDHYLTKTIIMSEVGVNGGKIYDIYFDSKTGQVVEFEIAKTSLSSLTEDTKRIHVGDIITIGKDVIIVRAQTSSVSKSKQHPLTINPKFKTDRIISSAPLSLTSDGVPLASSYSSASHEYQSGILGGKTNHKAESKVQNTVKTK